MAAFVVSAAGGETPTWDAAGIARIAAHGPWPPVVPPDPSNRVSGQADAIAFGQVLFHSARLSTVGGLRCSTCHEPWRSFADGRPRGVGADLGSRNTPTLLNVGLATRFGWDGANDSLWAQSVRPLLDPREMRGSAADVARLVRSDGDLAALYAAAFAGPPPADDDEVVLVGVGKALAAFQETLWSPRTPFDDFRDALLRGDAAAAAAYPLAARRGLGLFEGGAGCAQCHSGPAFGDNAFHRSLIHAQPGAGPADEGRASGVALLLASPYNLLGRHADVDSAHPRAQATLKAGQERDRSGAFRTPGLREVASTGPYMHDGSVANLCDAVGPHAVGSDGRSAPPPLSIDERRDLVAFLRSLSVLMDSPLIDAQSLRCP